MLGLPNNGTPEFEELSIPTEFVIGRLYHATWARKRGMVWRLVYIDSKTKQGRLETPKTKKIVYTRLEDLRDVNATMVNKLKKEY